MKSNQYKRKLNQYKDKRWKIILLHWIWIKLSYSQYSYICYLFLFAYLQFQNIFKNNFTIKVKIKKKKTICIGRIKSLHWTKYLIYRHRSFWNIHLVNQILALLLLNWLTVSAEKILMKKKLKTFKNSVVCRFFQFGNIWSTNSLSYKIKTCHRDIVY